MLFTNCQKKNCPTKNQVSYPFLKFFNEFIDFSESLCDAIREKGPTIQKIDFWIMRDSISL